VLNFRSSNIGFIILLIALIILDWQFGISNWYYAALGAIIIALHTYGSIVVSAEFFVPIKCKSNQSNNQIAITFDDGPLPYLTPRVLDILKQYNAPATFFCIGKRIAKHPEILQQVHAQGHIIGNHTFSHGKYFDLQSAGRMSEELKQTDDAIEKAIGFKPRFFRPPYGVTNPNLAKAISRGGYITMGWSVRSFDTITPDAEKLFNRVVNQLKGGDIILFHDYCESTITILPRLLDHINKIGLKVVRLDVLLNEKAYV
jgi:peptidoglycan/xylan/chitin deacetylase (PgdA/CDA1 family)